MATARGGKRTSGKASKSATKQPNPAARKVAPAARKAARPAGAKVGRAPTRVRDADPELFEPLSEGERADALRTFTEDRRLAQMAKIARYRVIAVEPLVVKPPHSLYNRRAARVVAYDYASDRAVHAAIDLDAGTVANLTFDTSQPMLSRDEESAAIAIALRDEHVKRELSLGEQPIAAMHYWSRRDGEPSFRRRSAAVLFGQAGARPSVVAVVDLLDAEVLEVVPATQW